MFEKFDGLKHLRIYFLLKRESINRVEIGHRRSIVSSSSIDGSNKMQECESSSLSRFHPIRNGGPK